MQFSPVDVDVKGRQGMLPAGAGAGAQEAQEARRGLSNSTMGQQWAVSGSRGGRGTLLQQVS